MIYGNLKSHPPIIRMKTIEKKNENVEKHYSEIYINNLKSEYINKCRKNGKYKPTEKQKKRFWTLREILKKNGVDIYYLSTLA